MLDHLKDDDICKLIGRVGLTAVGAIQRELIEALRNNPSDGLPNLRKFIHSCVELDRKHWPIEDDSPFSATNFHEVFRGQRKPCEACEGTGLAPMSSDLCNDPCGQCAGSGLVAAPT